MMPMFMYADVKHLDDTTGGDLDVIVIVMMLSTLSLLGKGAHL